MKTVHTKFPCNNINSLGHRNRKMCGRGLGVVKVSKNGSELVRARFNIAHIKLKNKKRS